MRIGIVSRCIRENKPKRFFKRPEIYKLEEGLYAAEIPFGRTDKLNDKKIRKIIEKAENALNADKILYTKELSKWVKTPFDLGDCFYKMAPKAIKGAMHRFEIKEHLSLAIRQENPDEKALYAAEKMIFDCKSIKLFTDKNQKGRKVSDIVMDEYGAVMPIFPYNSALQDGITLDLDKNNLCIFGKWVLEDFEADINTYGYNIDTAELYRAQGKNFDEIIIKSCRCGKNKLTLKAF